MIILSLDEKKGMLKVKIESDEDLWLLDLIISENDVVYAQTTREIKSKTGSKSKRLPMFLGVRVKKTEYHPFTNRLRITGIVIHGPEEFGLHGHYHTLSISPGYEVTIVKEKGISKSMLKKIKISEKMRFKVAIASIDYEDFCLAIARAHGVKVISTKAMQLPGKADAAREKILEEKVNSIANEIVETLISENIKNIVVTGPGFLKGKLAKTIKEVLKSKGVSVNVIVGHSSTGGIKGVFETTKSETIRKVIKTFELAEKEKLFEEVMKNLSLNTGKVALGINEVMKAAELGAIEYLLILDRTLKDLASGLSEVLEKILSNVEKYNGKIKIYTIHHEAGIQLKALGGIAALLRYSLKYKEE